MRSNELRVAVDAWVECEERARHLQRTLKFAWSS